MTSPSSRTRARPDVGRRAIPTGTADLASPAMPAWVMLPLRAFLGVTFVYAGLQKLADPNFFRAGASASMQAQLRAASRSSPIGGLLAHVQYLAVPVGLAIALAELVVGVATLLGLWSRLTAAAGLLLSLGFLLAVSWHSRPYYLGPDIVFCFAWTPLMLGPPGPWALDRWLAARARSEEQRFATNLVGIQFGTIQQICGHYDQGRCGARKGAVCEPGPCPVLVRPRLGWRPADVDFARRELLARARLAGLIALPVVVTGGLAAVVGRVLNHGSKTAATPRLSGPGTTSRPGTHSPSSTSPTSPTSGQPGQTTTTTTASGRGGTAIGPSSAVPVRGAASFTDPISGQPAYVVQSPAGQFRAFSAVCTHQGCTVSFSQQGNQFTCPCHGAIFDAATGSVVQGPARDPLPAITVSVRSGQVYVNG